MNHKTDFFKVFLPLFNFLKNYSALAGVSKPRLIDASEIASSPWAFFFFGGGSAAAEKLNLNFATILMALSKETSGRLCLLHLI